MEYIDLGLKSRTLWGSDYERDEQGNCLYLTFDEAKERFGDSLPDPWQFQELKDSCKWEWDGKKQGYKVTGPNGNSIFLAAMGFRRTDGVTALVGEYGTYWSSAPLGGDSGYYLNFGSSYHNPVNNGSRSHGRAIIRVKQAERARPVFYIKGELQIWQMLAALGIRPYKDGDQWCCLLGENIQEGIAGFGPTPFQSAVAFRNEFMGIE